MFKTIFNYNKNDNLVSCSGNVCIEVDKTSGEKVKVRGRRYKYCVEYSKKGVRELVISGTDDIYNIIQSYKDDTNIEKIIAKLGGNLSLLDTNKGFYTDVADIPRDYAEFHNRIEQGKVLFGGLPTDFKAEFGQDINQFMTSIYDKSFEKRLNDYVNRKYGKNNIVVNNNNDNVKQDVSKEVVNNE